MDLSYACRLICLTLCSAGMLQLLLESAAWLAVPSLLGRGAPADARRSERSLFLLALSARLGPWLVVLGAWVPAYIRGEDNAAPEHVGLLPLCGAVGFFLWWLLCSTRILRAWLTTRRYTAHCRQLGLSSDGIPILLHQEQRPFLAVAGLFRPRILVSESLLTADRFSPAALDIAFLHEGAHARHWDNLKLFVLSSLPHVALGTHKRPPLQQRWRLAAEMAADEEGSMGRPDSSVLLAELLVAMARQAGPPTPRAAFALLSHADDLRARVERLLRPQSVRTQLSVADARRWINLQAAWTCSLALAAFLALCVCCMQMGHRAAEILLHMG